MKTLVLLAALLLASNAAAAGRTVDRVAATVNGEPVALSEVEERAAEIRAGLPAGASRNQKALQLALEDLVGDKLFRKQVVDLGLEVSDAEVQAAIDDVRKTNGFADDAELERALASRSLTMVTYRENLKNQLSQMKLLNVRVRSRVKVGDEDVKRRYAELTAAESGEEEVRASHVLVKVAPEAPIAEAEAAKARAAEISKRARAGEDFAKLAKEQSEGASGDDGGDLGWFRRGEMTPTLEQAAFALKSGEVSEPVRSRFGFHVVKVTGRQAVRGKPLEEMEDEIRDRLYREETEKATQRFLDELKREAVVVYRMPELAPEAAP
jgi:peptidyl-prolyl cis-trans isomerase SurA